MADSLNEYLSAVTDQLRWKRTVPMVRTELSVHLEEQKEELLAQGLDEAAAEAEAVRRMGDPISVGHELDRVHRPKPQWLPLLLAAALACIGAYARVMSGTDAVRTLVYLLAGLGILFLCYFLDYTFFARHAAIVCFTVLSAALITLFLSPKLYGSSYYTSYLLMLFPFAYALGVYALRGRRLIAALALAVPFLALCYLTPNVTAAAVFLLSCFSTLIPALKKNWFRGSTHIARIVLIVLFVLAAFVFIRISPARLNIMLHPEADPYGAGFQGCTVRELLRDPQLIATGKSVVAGEFLDVSDFLLTAIAHSWGVLPFALVLLSLAALLIICAMKCMHTKNALGGIVSLSILLTLAVPAALSVAANLGYILALPGCPFLAGNLHSIFDLALLGIALSVFRQEKLPERHPAPTKRSPRITWEHGTLTIKFG